MKDVFRDSRESQEIRGVKGSRSREGEAGEKKPRREACRAGRGRRTGPGYSWVLEVSAPMGGGFLTVPVLAVGGLTEAWLRPCAVRVV